MPDHSTAQVQIDRLIATMTDQLTTLTRTLGHWMTSEPHTLGELEQQVIRTIKDVGAALNRRTLSDHPLLTNESCANACCNLHRIVRSRA